MQAQRDKDREFEIDQRNKEREYELAKRKHDLEKMKLEMELLWDYSLLSYLQ